MGRWADGRYSPTASTVGLGGEVVGDRREGLWGEVRVECVEDDGERRT